MSRFRLARRSLVAASVVIAGGLAAGPAVGPACAGDDAVAVVVRDGTGRERSECVEAGAGADGLDVLRATGAEIVTRDFGGRLGRAVCSIDGAGTPVTDCPSVEGHWHYWRLVDGRWVESPEGASNTRVRPGAVEGWTWVRGGEVRSPSVTSLAAACSLPALRRVADRGHATDSPRGPSDIGAVAGLAGAAGVLGTVGLVAARRRRG